MFTPSTKYNGEKERWPAFMRKWVAKSFDYGDPGKNGMYSEVVTAAVYNLRYQGNPFVIPLNAGSAPQGAQNPTSAQHYAHSEALEAWKILEKKYVEYQTAKRDFKSALKDDISDEVLALIEDPVDGLSFLSSLEILTRLADRYGKLMPVDIDNLYNKGRITYKAGMDYRKFEVTRKLIFAQLSAHGEVFAIETSTRFLIHDLTAECDLFKSTIESWRTDYPNTDDQKLKANTDALSAALTNTYVRSLNLGNITAASRNVLPSTTGAAAYVSITQPSSVAVKGICKGKNCSAKLKPDENGKFKYKICLACHTLKVAERKASQAAENDINA